MSLEQALAANTAALDRVAALLQNNNAPASNPVPPGPASVKTEEPKKTPAKKAAKKEEPPLEAPKEEPEVSYQQVSEAILAYNTKNGREKTLALLSQFGVAKGPDLKPEQYEEFLAAASGQSAASEDDLT